MHALKLKIEESNISLESQLEYLSLESNFIANVIEVFRNIVPNLANKLSDISSNFLVYDINGELISEMIKANNSLIKKIPHINPSNYDSVLASIPEGFKGDFLSYTNLLLDISPKLFNEANNLLSEYSFILSAFITNKDNKISLKDYTLMYTAARKQREELANQISDYFPSGNNSKDRINKVLNRFADLDSLVKATTNLNKNQNQVNLRDISKSTKEIVELLNIIVDNVRKGNVTNISGSAAKNIADGAYELAKLIEFVSVFSLRIQQIIVANSKLVIQLDSTIK